MSVYRSAFLQIYEQTGQGTSFKRCLYRLTMLRKVYERDWHRILIQKNASYIFSTP